MGFVLAIVAALLGAFIGPLARLAMDSGLRPLEVAFWRAALAGVAFAVHAAVLRCPRPPARDLAKLSAFGAFGMGSLYAGYLLCIREGGAALASILLYTAPVWVLLGSILFLKEKATRRTLLAMGLSMLGVLGVSVGPGFSGRGPALAFGLLSGVAYAAYFLLGKRLLSRYPAPLIFAVALPSAAVVLAILSPPHLPSLRGLYVLLPLALLGTFAVYGLQYAALSRLAPGPAAIAALVEPVGASLLSAALFGEKLGVLGWCGLGLVLVGVALTAFASPSAPPPAPVDAPVLPPGGEAP